MSKLLHRVVINKIKYVEVPFDEIVSVEKNVKTNHFRIFTCTIN
jgi:hypothetical protein